MPDPKISPRKLRLFACACARQVWDRLVDDAPCPTCCDGKWVGRNLNVPGAVVCPTCSGSGRINRSRRAVEVAERYADGLATAEELDAASHEAANVAEYDDSAETELAWRCAYRDTLALTQNAGLPRWFSVSTKYAAAQAALLRCIAGNPCRPMVLPSVCLNCGSDSQEPEVDYACCGRCGRTKFGCPWITLTVLSLAEAAYQERRGRACERCRGKGKLKEVYPGQPVKDWAPGYSPAMICMDCPDCHGSGRVEDGALDPDRLAILADALEEAGCPVEVPCLEGWKDQATGKVASHPHSCFCDGTGMMVHPLLTHLRLPGPHVRGCYVIDSILGKR